MSQYGLISSASKNIWAFDPRTVGSCVLWLDGADSNTITFSSGSNVSTWTDKSGQGNTATAVASGFGTTVAPTYTASNKYVNFGGSSAMTTALSASSNIETGFVVGSVTALATNTFLGGTVSGGFNTGGRQFRTSAGGTYGTLTYNNGGVASYASIAMNSPFAINTIGLLEYSINTGAPTLYEYGKSLGTGTTATLTASRVTVIGARGGASSYAESLTGNIYEILVFSSPLSTQQQQVIEGYLSWKWGLQANLPATHPFTSVSGTIQKLFARQFSPVDISGCLLWLDGKDTSIIGLSGTTVTSWSDKSGNLNNITSFSTPSPVYNTSTGYIAFSGGTGTTPTITLTSTTLYSIFYVITFPTGLTDSGSLIYVRPFAQPSNTFFFGINRGSYTPPGTSNVGYYLESNAGSGPYAFFASGQGYNTYSGDTFVCSTTQTGSTTYIYSLNGNTISATTATATMANKAVVIGSIQSGAAYNLGELIFYDGALTTSQRQQVEGYLAWKWGVLRTTYPGTTNLPTTHPFYKIPTNTATPFNPHMVSGLALWLDSADTTTITQSGGNVSQWNDKSGNGYNFAQGTSANQPTYSPSTPTNGVYFTTDLSTNYTFMTINTAGLALFQNISYGTTFLVFKTTTSTQNTQRAYPLIATINGGNSGRYGVYISNTTLTPGFFGRRIDTDSGNGANSSTAFSTNTAYVQSYQIDYADANAVTLIQYRNGTSDPVTPTSFTYTSSAGNTSNTASAYIFLNGITPTSAVAQLYLYEVIVYTNRLLTTSQRQQVEGYLAWKWGLQTNLPSTHPYYKLRP